MMFALIERQRQLAAPGLRARCPFCDTKLIAKCGMIRVWHWAHINDRECDPWSEPESEWHLGWKKHLPNDRVEVTIRRGEAIHRADILAKNGAILELQASTLSAQEIQARENFYKHMVWLYRVTWEERLHYGKSGFWWKHGSIAQTFITKPLFWEFEEEGRIQQIKLAKVEGANGGDRVVGKAIKTYSREQFVAFVVDGSIPAPGELPKPPSPRCKSCQAPIEETVVKEAIVAGGFCRRCDEEWLSR